MSHSPVSTVPVPVPVPVPVCSLARSLAYLLACLPHTCLHTCDSPTATKLAQTQLSHQSNGDTATEPRTAVRTPPPIAEPIAIHEDIGRVRLVRPLKPVCPSLDLGF